MSNFLALITAYNFSRSWHRLKFFPRLAPATTFRALTTGYNFSRAWHRAYSFQRLGTGCRFYRLWHRLQLLDIEHNFSAHVTGSLRLTLITAFPAHDSGPMWTCRFIGESWCRFVNFPLFGKRNVNILVYDRTLPAAKFGKVKVVLKNWWEYCIGDWGASAANDWAFIQHLADILEIFVC